MKVFNIPLFYYFVVAAILMTKVPVVGKFFNIINTAIHELGHALMALILEGKVHRIELFSDSAGSTTTQNKGKFRTFMVAISGYPFASAVAYFSFYLLNFGYEKHLLIGLSILFLFMLLLWIRNVYGVIWVLLFCRINVFLLYYNNIKIINIAALFYATVILTESVFSTFTLLYLSLKYPQQAGDATNLKKITHIPTVIWALLFVAFSGWIAYEIWARFI